MKNIVFTLILAAQANLALAYTLDEQGVLISEDGVVEMMDWYEAMKVCPQGTHLPTAREYADFAIKNGASEEASATSGDGYGVTVKNREKRMTDQFYIYHSSYKSPGSRIEANAFWTSSFGENTGKGPRSVPMPRASLGYKRILAFYGNEGRIFEALNDSDKNAVICLKGEAVKEVLPKATTKCADFDAYLDEDSIVRILSPEGFYLHDGAYCSFDTHESVANVCPVGTHLPTMREAAERARTFGYSPLVEVSAGKPDGWNLLSGKNPDGEADSFFYPRYSVSDEPYRREVFGVDYFWTSTVSDSGKRFFYSEHYGYLRDEYQQAKLRCLKN